MTIRAIISFSKKTPRVPEKPELSEDPSCYRVSEGASEELGFSKDPRAAEKPELTEDLQTPVLPRVPEEFGLLQDPGFPGIFE
ncbi:hypothetical protein K502DRAFT_349376 [Neoconidiobolus thromboides FSU 785]|nr:hypothetical protein K502DRAFT_349376 [Neoconidiobolus thromboides FSU 785]